MIKLIRNLVGMIAALAITACSTPTAAPLQPATIPPYLVAPLAKSNITSVAAIHYRNEGGNPISEQQFAAEYEKTRRFAMTTEYKGSLPDVSLRIVSIGETQAAGMRGKSPPFSQRMPATDAIADLKTCAMPVYPKSELRAGHTGIVTMSFLVSADGLVKKAEIATSSGYPILDQAALDSLMRCRFKPAMADGVAQERWSPVQYVWTIR